MACEKVLSFYIGINSWIILTTWQVTIRRHITASWSSSESSWRKDPLLQWKEDPHLLLTVGTSILWRWQWEINYATRTCCFEREDSLTIPTAPHISLLLEKAVTKQLNTLRSVNDRYWSRRYCKCSACNDDVIIRNYCLMTPMTPWMSSNAYLFHLFPIK